jgi:hypothetical protein
VRVPYNVASFSSRGTTFDDGRIKPDLVVPGEHILSAAAPGVDGDGFMIPTQVPYCGVPSPTSPRTIQLQNNFAAKTMSGTSMATPLAAGAAEKIRQYFKQGYYPSGVKGQGAQINPDESLLRAVILASAQPLINGGVWNGQPYEPSFSRFSPIASSKFIPDIFGGFGMPILDNAVTMPSGTHKMFYISEQFSSSSGASAFNIACSQSSTPVTLVLAWTDPPGFTSSKRQLVNDLDLIVLVPGSSPAQLFGNMRESADQSNNVERTICSCPSGSSITAIVVPGESLKTSLQTWYLVANGPITQAISKLPSVPTYRSGRIIPPQQTTTSCQYEPRSTYTLYFLPGQVWTGSSWQMLLKYQEFCAALSTFARVNFQAVDISLASASDGTATLSLGCSIVPATVSSLQYITASTLLSTIKSNCAADNSICTTDSVLSVFNWTAFASGSSPPSPPPSPPAADECAVSTSCVQCTSAAACGWCPNSGNCKTGTSSQSNDGLCTNLGWVWLNTHCEASPTPSPDPSPPSPDPSPPSPDPSPPSPGPSPGPVPTPSPITTASFVFRIQNRDFLSWTDSDTVDFKNGIQALLKNGVGTVRVLGVRSGSVIVDTEVTLSSSQQLSAVNAIFTDPFYLQQVGVYGGSLSGMAVGTEANSCTIHKTADTCKSTSVCGWCLKVASCLPGTTAGATIPAGSSATCTGSDWQFSGSSCASIYFVVSACFLSLSENYCSAYFF